MQQEKDDREKSSIQRESSESSPVKTKVENGIRILARMIAEAYLEELDLEHQQLKAKEAVAEPPPSKTNLIKKIPKRRLALTVPETTKLLGLDRGSVYDGVMSGQIPSVRIGQKIIIPRAALVKYLSEATKPRETREKTETSEGVLSSNKPECF